MKQLSCDHKVWKNLFSKIWDYIHEEDVTEIFNPKTLNFEVVKVKDPEFFTKETLTRMAKFCNLADFSSELRGEVLKLAAGMMELPSQGYDSFEEEEEEIEMRISIMLTIQGWTSTTFEELDGTCLKELIVLEEKLGVKAKILDVKTFGDHDDEENQIKILADRVRQNFEKVRSVWLDEALLYRDFPNRDEIDAYISLLGTNTKEWSVSTLWIDDNKDNWASLARIARDGHIFFLQVLKVDSMEEVEVEDLRKVWEATYDLKFEGGDWYHGGRLNNTEEDWQRILLFLGKD